VRRRLQTQKLHEGEGTNDRLAMRRGGEVAVALPRPWVAGGGGGAVIDERREARSRTMIKGR
jgi:hypothetical protein